MLAKTKQWGNSLALIIPRNKVKELKLKPGEEISIKLEKKSNILKELFGAIHFSKSTERLLKESRKNTSKWD
ncbi:MAG: hypothetical protein AABY07_07020 [Nanoarchaeota archaeon]